jgi:TPR repeat protein
MHDPAVEMRLVRVGRATVAWVIGWVGSGCATPTSAPAAAPLAANRCGERSPAPCEAACFAGDGSACAIFGAALEGMADPPVRLPQDLPRGRRALSHGCELGNLAACRTLASYDDDGVGSQVACPAWESICARGDQRSCAFLATCLLYAKGVPHDPKRALPLLEQGCRRGERVSCRELGFVYRRGELVPPDLTRSFAYLDYACRQDDPLGCSEAAADLEAGKGTARDLDRAKSLYRLACARGIRPVPCTALRRLGEEPPSSVVSSSDVAGESNYVSQPFAFEWRLPANWEFVPPPTSGPAVFVGAEEIVSAQPRAGGVPESLTIGLRSERAGSLDQAERAASAWMRTAGVGKIRAERISFFSTTAVRVDGLVTAGERQFLTVVLFYRGGHRFELRCLTPEYQSGFFCRDAFGGMIFTDGFGPGGVPGN